MEDKLKESCQFFQRDVPGSQLSVNSFEEKRLF